MTTLTRLQRMQLWAADHKSFVETDGTIGFGRSCVGIVRDDKYISFEESYEINGKVYNPNGCDPEVARVLYDTSPPNAYHKGNYFAVLFSEGADDQEREVNRLIAMDMLMKWWEEGILANRLAIKTVETKPDSLIQALFTGVVEPVFCKEGDQ